MPKDKARIAYFTGQQHSGFFRSISDKTQETLEHSYNVDIFSDAECNEPFYPYHEFTWRNLKKPYDLVIYNFHDETENSFMLPFILTVPGIVILRTMSINSDLWHMHALDGTERDFVEEMVYCYGAKGRMLAQLQWRGMWSNLFDRKFPAFKLLADCSLAVITFDEYIQDNIINSSAAETVYHLAPPFVARKPKKGNTKTTKLLSLYSDTYNLDIERIFKIASGLLNQKIDISLTIFSDEVNRDRLKELEDKYSLKGKLETVTNQEVSVIDKHFENADFLLLLDDPANPVPQLPIDKAICNGVIPILTDSSARMLFPDELIYKIPFSEIEHLVPKVIKDYSRNQQSFTENLSKLQVWYKGWIKESSEGLNSGSDSFESSLKAIIERSLEGKKDWVYPIDFPEHLRGFPNRLKDSIKDRLSDFLPDEGIEKAIDYVIDR